jgi:hypothetical protein
LFFSSVFFSVFLCRPILQSSLCISRPACSVLPTFFYLHILIPAWPSGH